jgi:hypothetical protein
MWNVDDECGMWMMNVDDWMMSVDGSADESVWMWSGGKDYLIWDGVDGGLVLLLFSSILTCKQKVRMKKVRMKKVRMKGKNEKTKNKKQKTKKQVKKIEKLIMVLTN